MATKDLPALPRLSANDRITGTDRERLTRQVVRHYKNGTSCREIAEALGRSYGFVHKMLEEDGIDMRTRGGNQTKGTGARSSPTTNGQVPGTPDLPKTMRKAAAPAAEALSPGQKRAAAHAAAKAAPPAAKAKVTTRSAAAVAASGAKRVASKRAAGA